MEATQKLKWYKKLVVILTISTIIPSTMVFMSVTPFAPAVEDTPQSVSKDEARKSIKNFRNRPDAVENEVTGVRIEASQLESMNNIKATEPATTAFRVYFAQDSIGAPLSIVVGVNEDDGDQTETIYSTARKGSNLCPPMCDAGSPLTN